jgi:succinate dehydrogenase / fumarate reductase flavoprotein subunit
MDKVIVIGSGIAGCSCATRLAEAGLHVLLVSPHPSERAQSVMAAGGINAVLRDCDKGDSIDCHVDDTLRVGYDLAGERAVRSLCENAPEVIAYLERIGTVFSLERDGSLARRAFGGQTHQRTYYCGSSTGKQIVSALVMEVRRFEARGLIQRRLWSSFYSALIRDGRCHGAMLYDERIGGLVTEHADALVMATGGQNALFGKTTGSTLCDGYAAGRLFAQGVDLKNLEFVQYHPTTIETAQKRMLISEAVRGEGGRLFYYERDAGGGSGRRGGLIGREQHRVGDKDGRRVYFMEDKYGSRGNLMPRDVVSQEIAATGREVFLDASFLGKDLIDKRLPEVRDICRKYRGIDIAKEPIPVAPSVHFFMGGIAVDNQHETNVDNLFAIGECASMYHGANRLGGNSLLAAIHSGWVAADAIVGRTSTGTSRTNDRATPDFSQTLIEENDKLLRMRNTSSVFPVMYLRDLLSKTMAESLGIVRDEDSIARGLSDVDYYLSVADKISYDPSAPMYANYSLAGILTLAKAALACARERRESRGAHVRSDYPAEQESFCHASIVSFEDGQLRVWLDKDKRYER